MFDWPSSVKQNLNEIKSETNFTKLKFRSLADFNSIRINKFLSNLAYFEAKSIIKTVKSILESKNGISSVKYVESVSLQNFGIESDKSRIQQVLLSILQNATFYTHLRSEISICVSTRPFESNKITNRKLKNAPNIDTDHPLSTLLVYSV